MMFVLDFILPFLLGVVFTIGVAAVLILYWFYRQPLSNAPATSKYVEPTRNERLNEMLEVPPQTETCIWLNLVVDFLFHELRDSQEVRSLVMKFMKKEFEEFMTTKTEGRMLEQLTVREYSLGTSLPLIKSATVKTGQSSEEVDIALDVDYSGNFHIEIDADLMFSKVAFISVTVQRLSGRGRLQFSRNPSTHWSFMFYEEPELFLEVASRVEGRKIPQLSSIIENQIRKWVKRKHTMPGKKIRYKPFFKAPKPQNELLDVFVHDQKITVGMLQVQVVECTRLPMVEHACEVFCTVNIAATPFKPTCLWQTQWPVKEFVIHKKENVSVGIDLYSIPGDDKVADMVLVTRVSPGSAASIAGLRKGDIVTRINNMRVPNCRSVQRVIQKSKEQRILVTVERPLAHVVERLLGKVILTSDSTSEGGLTEPPGTGRLPRKQKFAPHLEVGISGDTDSGLLSQDAGPDHTRHVAEDTVSLCGVGGEVDVMNELRQRRPMSTKSTASPGVGLGVVHSAPEPAAAHVDDLLSENLTTPTSEFDAPATFPAADEGMNSDPESGDQKTRTVEANRNPSWNDDFMFVLEDHHHYLNVCVWLTLGEGKGKLLLGHVTISLTDIAVYCLSTSAGIHQQCYSLVPAQLSKVTVSRTVLEANSSGGKLSKPAEVIFGGDIILRFQHTPQSKDEAVKSNNKEKQEDREEEGEEPNEEDRQKIARHRPPSTATKDHQFHSVEVKDANCTCSICSKKIRWTVRQCAVCELNCHKKCAEYCMKEVPCYRHEHADTESGEVRPVNVESEHVQLKSTPPLLKHHLQTITKEGDDEESDEEDEQRLLELGASLYSDQPLEVRIPALEKKIAELETEITRVTELITFESDQLPMSGNVQRSEDRIARHEEKIEPLQLLLKQHRFALSQSQAEREH